MATSRLDPDAANNVRRAPLFGANTAFLFLFVRRKNKLFPAVDLANLKPVSLSALNFVAMSAAFGCFPVSAIKFDYLC